VKIHDALFEQFEHSQEPNDDVEPLDECLCQGAKRQPSATRQLVQQLLDRINDRGSDRRDMEKVDTRFRLGLMRLHVRVVEFLRGDPGERIRSQIDITLIRTVDARVTARSCLMQRSQHKGRILECLAFQKSSEQQVAFFPQSEFLIKIAIVEPRYEASRLEFDERGSNQQELCREVEVEGLHLFKHREILVHDGDKRDLVQVDLFAKNQMQQQVERTCEHRRLDLNCHREDNTREGSQITTGEFTQAAGRFSGMTRVFSGIQPTGQLHLGNLVGAVANWVDKLDATETVICIVDLHALTIARPPGELNHCRLDLAAWLIAAGVDPNRCILFEQSRVPEHNQLGWIMECVTSYGELSRMTQFKDKRDRVEFISAGLFSYPALQAADILLYDTDEVPVGDDQRQHIELCRDAAERFNARYGTTFVVPRHVIPPVGARVMDLANPTAKMSKSLGDSPGTIWLSDDPKAIEKKCKRAVTDSLDTVSFDRERQPGVTNLLEILAVASGQDPHQLASSFGQYGALKVATAEAVISYLAPIQARHRELMDDPAELRRILVGGAERAQQIASDVLSRVHTALGIRP
jgi:tryptophanyl-tRNA synthetase